MLLNYLKELTDSRRGQGQQYQIHYILLFSIYAVLCGANSYRDIERFIIIHFDRLDELYDMGWTRAPSFTTIRNIILGLNRDVLEYVFRRYATSLKPHKGLSRPKCIAIDGKTLRGSFNNLEDKKALHILSVFDTCNDLILGHYETEEKSNEIPALVHFLEEIDLSGYIITLDAMHCQKNNRNNYINR
jgi:hypothetical protein